MTTATFTPAKRGDLAAVVQRHSEWNNVAKRSHEYTTVDFGTVASITREGRVKMVRLTWGGIEYRIDRLPHVQVLVVDAGRVDVQAALEAAKQHVWPGHDDQPKPFDSVEEARDFVKQFAR